MTTFEQAQKYLSAIPPSISGQQGHSQALNACRALVIGFNLSDNEAMPLLQDWNRTCQPPWSQKELEHKLREAANKPFDKPRGYLLTHRSMHAGRPSASAPGPVWRPELPKQDYDLSEAQESDLPKGKTDGFRKVLETCFRPGEGVRVMSGMDDAGLIRCDASGGVILKQEEWLAKLDEFDNINMMYSRMGGPPVGVYLGVNPMTPGGGSCDKDVLVHRHCLIEFDNMTLSQQWMLYVKSRKEYDERVQLLYNHFAKFNPDPHNKNPSRFSRCPDAKRGNTIQYLLATNMGCESFTAWSKHLLVQGIGVTYDSDQILDYRPEKDLMTVAGNQWLRKGGSAILVGPSGIGKSSLGYQIAYSWALGKPCFGVAPARPLKILMIQAENDLSDLNAMGTGIAKGLEAFNDPGARALLLRNLITNHNVADTGHDFILAMQRLVDHHEPDLVIVDPLLSFIGDDISKQEVVGKFCRNWLNPILTNSRTAFLGIHHTGKPAMAEKVKKGQKPHRRSMAEWSYTMMGSSELTNWARAVMILNALPSNEYELIFSKRGKQAEATHPDGSPTLICHLRHAQEGIFWHQVDPPEEVATATETAEPVGPRKSMGRKAKDVATSNLHDFLKLIPAEGWRQGELAQELNAFAANKLGIDLGEPRAGTTTRAVGFMLESHKLEKTKDGFYVKGTNA
jgi:hypothetical protein